MQVSFLVAFEQAATSILLYFPALCKQQGHYAAAKNRR
jgi:hypothetical protein